MSKIVSKTCPFRFYSSIDYTWKRNRQIFRCSHHWKTQERNHKTKKKKKEEKYQRSGSIIKKPKKRIEIHSVNNMS